MAIPASRAPVTRFHYGARPRRRAKLPSPSPDLGTSSPGTDPAGPLSPAPRTGEGGMGSGSRARDQYSTAVGGLVLTTCTLPRSEERRRLGQLGHRRLDARRPLRRWQRARGAPPPLRALLAQGPLRPRPREAGEPLQKRSCTRASSSVRSRTSCTTRHPGPELDRRSKPTSYTGSQVLVSAEHVRTTGTASPEGRAYAQVVVEHRVSESDADEKAPTGCSRRIGDSRALSGLQDGQIARKCRESGRSHQRATAPTRSPLRDVHGPARGAVKPWRRRAASEGVRRASLDRTWNLSTNNVTDDASRLRRRHEAPRPQDDQR